MAKISGIYCNGFGEPRAGVTLELTARATSSNVIMTTKASQKTSNDGSYNFEVMPCTYVVTANKSYLGIIQVYTDSPDASLNQYLAAFNPDAVTPEILAEMQALLIDACAAAKSAQESAEMAASYATQQIVDFEGPGFIGFFSIYTNTRDIFLKPGAEVPASSLLYSGISDPAAFMIQSYSHPAGGTWRSLGFAACQGKLDGKAVLPFQRVDTAPNPKQLLRSTRAGVRNCIYSTPDKTLIDCEVYRGGSWHPFTASFSDNTTWGREIYSNAQKGWYGVVAEYSAPTK